METDCRARRRTAILRLVNQRLVATSGDDEPSTGHFPIHLGQLSDFDDGFIPRSLTSQATSKPFAKTNRYGNNC